MLDLQEQNTFYRNQYFRWSTMVRDVALMAKLRADAADKGPLADLNERERTLIDLIGEGLTNRQVAKRMFLAEKTVKNYVSRLLTKLDMERRTQVAVYATELRTTNGTTATSGGSTNSATAFGHGDQGVVTSSTGRRGVTPAG